MTHKCRLGLLLYFYVFQSQTYILKFGYEYSANYSHYSVVYTDTLKGPDISTSHSAPYCLSKVNETFAVLISLALKYIHHGRGLDQKKILFSFWVHFIFTAQISL